MAESDELPANDVVVQDVSRFFKTHAGYDTKGFTSTHHVNGVTAATSHSPSFPKKNILNTREPVSHEISALAEKHGGEYNPQRGLAVIKTKEGFTHMISTQVGTNYNVISHDVSDYGVNKKE